MLIDLKGMAAECPTAWKSTIFGKVASANLKVLRMDECAYEAESHDYAEALDSATAWRREAMAPCRSSTRPSDGWAGKRKTP